MSEGPGRGEVISDQFVATLRRIHAHHAGRPEVLRRVKSQILDNMNRIRADPEAGRESRASAAPGGSRFYLCHGTWSVVYEVKGGMLTFLLLDHYGI